MPAAKSAASAAMSACSPCTRSRPSAPTGVVTTGVPAIIDWITLRFTPAPCSSGTTARRDCSMYGCTDGTQPTSRTPGVVGIDVDRRPGRASCR